MSRAACIKRYFSAASSALTATVRMRTVVPFHLRLALAGERLRRNRRTKSKIREKLAVGGPAVALNRGFVEMRTVAGKSSAEQ
jgi:hypothetical protein